MKHLISIMMVLAACGLTVAVADSCKTPNASGGAGGEQTGEEMPRDPCEISDNYYKLAVAAMSEHNNVLARQNLTKAEQMCPKNERVQNLFGLLDLSEGNYDSALKRFERAVELDEKYTDAIHNIAAVYMAKEDWQNAIKYLKIVETDTLYNYPYLVERNLGWCYYKLGDKAKAKEHLQKAVFIEEYMCRAWYELGLIAKEEGETDEAISDFKNAVRGNKQVPAKSCEGFALAHYELGLLYTQQHEREKAKEHFEKCVKITADMTQNTLNTECSKMVQLLK